MFLATRERMDERAEQKDASDSTGLIDWDRSTFHAILAAVGPA